MPLHLRGWNVKYSRTKLAAGFEYTICEAYPLGQGYNVKIHMSRVLSGKLPTQKPTPQKPPQLRFT